MTPAELLKGQDLGNGWMVKEIVQRKPNATGGFFSVGYLVKHTDGRRGFLKALDLTKAMQGSGATKLEQMQWLISTYLFEKQLCNKCNHLSRVARALESGSFNQDHENPYFEVFYLIFELADHDIRAHFDDQDYLDTVFTLKMLHDVSVGISQLHRADIAHQDLKPSNVLVYSNQGSKICDLGRAWDKRKRPNNC